jgi:hypothetical protein
LLSCPPGPHSCGVKLLDILFPYRVGRDFGVTSFALVFVVIFLEVDLIVALALIQRLDLFVEMQIAIIPAAVLVSLISAAVFTWRARAWTRARIKRLGARTPDAVEYAERLAQQRRSQG